MIDLKERPEIGWDLLLVVSLLGVIAAIWFAFLQPRPAAAASYNPQATLQHAQSQAQVAEEAADKSEKSLKDRTWDITPEVFGSKTLESLTNLATKSHLQLSAFRMGKTILASGLQQAPFTVIVEGAFLDVMAFVDNLEQPESKIAVNQLQVASTNNADRVTATLALTGFLYKEEK